MRSIKVTDYIAEFLIQKGVTDIFGYPGGMVTHLMDSFSKFEGRIHVHTAYHEQAAAFEACGYAQASGRMGAAFATSGPGATNLLTGICHAYFDSVPVLFFTGQVNTFEKKRTGMRQRGFQETDIVDMVKGVTKYAACVETADVMEECLEEAYAQAMQGRKGPVLLDIPMDVQRAHIRWKGNVCALSEHEKAADKENSGKNEKNEKNGRAGKEKTAEYPEVLNRLYRAKKPCMLLGAGLKGQHPADVVAFADHMGIPAVTSMTAVDLLPYGHPLFYGYIGAYGSRAANFITAKCDLLLALGSRLDIRQTGRDRAGFAPHADIIRFDIDRKELEYPVRSGEMGIQADAGDVLAYLMKNYQQDSHRHAGWKRVCDAIAEKLDGLDAGACGAFVENISMQVPENTVITTDVGQNQVWVAQSWRVKTGQRILFSGGHGAMGYSLPAAIGAYYTQKKPVVSISGDGGMQMNLQELAFVRRERLPVKIFVLNNGALGMIRHFQEMYFAGNETQTVRGKGYEAPDFKRIAGAYDIPYVRYEAPEDVSGGFMRMEGPVLTEIRLTGNTYVYPKLEYGKAVQDQEPLLDRRLYEYLMKLDIKEEKEEIRRGGYLLLFWITFWAYKAYFGMSGDGTHAGAGRRAGNGAC